MKPREMPEPVRLALEELKQALSKLYGERLRGVYLYGSYARGDFTEDSDVDVLVVLDGPIKPGAEISYMSPVVSEICLRRALLITMWPLSADTLERNGGVFLDQVRKEAVLL